MCSGEEQKGLREGCKQWYKVVGPFLSSPAGEMFCCLVLLLLLLLLPASLCLFISFR